MRVNRSPVSLSRRLFLGSAIASFASAGLADAPGNSLRPRLRGDGARRVAPPRISSVEELVRAANLDGRVGFAVAEAKTGLVLESRDSTIGLPPASVTKSLTALYALDRLGPDHRFTTRVLAIGEIEDGVLKGDLVLAGGGDPTLDTEGLARLVDAMKAKGLRKVTGRFLVWGGHLPYRREIDRGQPDHVSYSPAVCGIALNYNAVHFEWKRTGPGKYDLAMQAPTANYRPDVTTATMAVAERKMPVYTFSDADGRENWTVAKWALGNGGARYLPVRRPEIFAGDVFRSVAAYKEVTLPAPEIASEAPADDATVLAEEQSDTLREILRAMLKYSNNLIAEMVGMAATAAGPGRPDSLRASAAAMNDWATTTLGLSAPALVDHSGLGDASRLSTSDMVRALVAVHGTDTLRPILKRHAMHDSKGRKTFDHPVKVSAKTGTLNFVSALAGYMTAADGTEMAFAIFTADMERREGLSEAERERPEGGRAWASRSRRLQVKLIERWGALYGS